MKIKDKELSSTQRLLEVISGKPFQADQNQTPENVSAETAETKNQERYVLSQARQNEPSADEPAKTVKPDDRKRFVLFNAKRKTRVGIWMDDRYICGVVVSDETGGKKMISQWWIEEIRYFSGGREGLPSAVSEKLKQMCDKSVSQIWLSGLFNNVDVRYLLLPKMTDKIMDRVVLSAFFKKEVKNKKEKALSTNYDKKQMIFDFQKIESDIKTNEEPASVVAYSAHKEDIVRLQNDFEQAGVGLSGISFLAFSVRNLIRSRALITGKKHLCTLFIGMDHSVIDIFFPNGELGLSRRIRTSVKSMIRAVETSVYTASGTEFSLFNANEKRFDFEASLETGDSGREDFFWRKIEADDFLQQQDGIPLKEVLDRLIWQVERTIDYFDGNIGPVQVETMILLGQTTAYSSITTYLRQQMELAVDVLDISCLSPSFYISPAVPTPPDILKQNLIALGAGAALSSSGKTANLLMPREKRTYQEKIHKINRYLLAAFVIVFCSCIFYYYQQRMIIQQKNIQIARLEQEYERIIEKDDGVYASYPFIERQVSSITDVYSHLRKALSRRVLFSVVAEIVNSLPAEIRLLRFKTSFEKNDNNVFLKRKGCTIEIKGMASGEALSQEKKVMEFFNYLEKNDLFSNVKIQKKYYDKFHKEKVLQFVFCCEAAGGEI